CHSAECAQVTVQISFAIAFDRFDFLLQICPLYLSERNAKITRGLEFAKLFGVFILEKRAAKSSDLAKCTNGKFCMLPQDSTSRLYQYSRHSG
ncbi:MAG: hypothetical protein AAFW73_02535, partial [Bacteroidota bacterium]